MIYLLAHTCMWAYVYHGVHGEVYGWLLGIKFGSSGLLASTKLNLLMGPKVMSINGNKDFCLGCLVFVSVVRLGSALFCRETRSPSVACTGIELTLVILPQPPRARIRVCVTVPGCPLNEASQFLMETHFWLHTLFTKICTLQVCILTLSCPLSPY